MTADTERERVARMLCCAALENDEAWDALLVYPNIQRVEIARFRRMADAVIADRAQREAAVAVAVRALVKREVHERIRATMMHESVKDVPIPQALWHLMRNLEHETGALPVGSNPGEPDPFDLSTIAPAAADVERKLRERVEFARAIGYMDSHGNYGPNWMEPGDADRCNEVDLIVARARVAAGEG